MNFSEYAKILYEFRKGDACKYKHEFVQKLLEAGQENPEVIYEIISDTKAGNDRLRKYLSGKLNISGISLTIKSSLDRSKFIDDIAEIYMENDVAYICDSFKQFNEDIEPDDIQERLYEIYSKILEEAAGIDPSDSNAISISRAPKSIIPRDDITKIRALIKTLADTIGDLLKLGNQIELWGRNHLATPFAKHPNWQEFQESHKRYNSLCEELQNYVKIYPCQLLEDALNNSKTYGYMEFLWFKDGGVRQAKHDEIEAYRNKLLGTYRELG